MFLRDSVSQCVCVCVCVYEWVTGKQRETFQVLLIKQYSSKIFLLLKSVSYSPSHLVPANLAADTDHQDKIGSLIHAEHTHIHTNFTEHILF